MRVQNINNTKNNNQSPNFGSKTVVNPSQVTTLFNFHEAEAFEKFVKAIKENGHNDVLEITPLEKVGDNLSLALTRIKETFFNKEKFVGSDKVTINLSDLAAKDSKENYAQVAETTYMSVASKSKKVN